MHEKDRDDDSRQLANILTSYKAAEPVPVERMWRSIAETLVTDAPRRMPHMRWMTQVRPLVAAAMVIGAVILGYQLRQRAASPVARTPAVRQEVIGGDRDTILSRALASLPTDEARRTVRSIIAPLDTMIRETDDASRADPHDAFLQRHLTELRDRRSAMLSEIASHDVEGL